MHFQSGFCTNALQRLERLTASLHTGGLSSAAIAHAISTIDNILSDLGSQVANNDRLDIQVGSEEELVFRTARLIIDTQLDHLDVAIRCIVADNAPEPSAPSMWRSFLSALLLAKAELWRVTRIW